jgi:hypothetical protein
MNTRFHKSAIWLLFALAALPFVLTSTARSQATIGAGDGKNTVSVDFYKVPPGRQDEWLALYKKNHYPI